MFIKHFNLFLILAFAIIGVFSQTLDACISSCVEAEAGNCYVGYGIRLTTFFRL